MDSLFRSTLLISIHLLRISSVLRVPYTDVADVAYVVDPGVVIVADDSPHSGSLASMVFYQTAKCSALKLRIQTKLILKVWTLHRYPPLTDQFVAVMLLHF
ncbi:hypothetical protein WICMUC_000413 [Wickerhamomyces mucosus]|uniref:Secreted protein n=1 Tax=Wickerhamomyces mucosus TaxID=1378264 RepID=A0A9P8TJ81_9ASCO|nr:hypothetical protein WICMUC_000413 [Wickerhamomyces mucosus]